MFKKKNNPQDYWNERSLKFANYYENPSKFDLIFRKGIFRRFERTVEVCNSFDKPTVLDIGSGPGINSINLLRHAKVSYVTGIDFAPNMIDYANRYAKQSNMSDLCNFIEGDFMKYNWGDNKFDITIALGVFDYVDNPEDFIIKMANITTKAFVISWPGNGIRMFLRKIRYTCPVHYYTEKQIRFLHNQCASIKRLKLYEGSAGWASVAYM